MYPKCVAVFILPFLFFVEARAIPRNQMIERCVDHLGSSHRPNTRARILSIGETVRYRPEISAFDHVVVLMEQATSHNYLMLLKTLVLDSLKGMGRKAIHCSPHDLLLLELSEEEHAAFVREAIEVGTVGLTTPRQSRLSAYGIAPIFPGSILMIDDSWYVALQDTAHATYSPHQACKRKSTYMIAALPEYPAPGVVGTKTHFLEVGTDGKLKLDDRSIDGFRPGGQATVLMTALLNAIDGPQTRVEILELNDSSAKFPNTREIVIKDFRETH